MSSHRIPDGEITLEPYKSRMTCAHGHPWTPETTRWRRRIRGGGRGVTIERDCLVCKRVSEGRRLVRRAADRRYT